MGAAPAQQTEGELADRVGSACPTFVWTAFPPGPWVCVQPPSWRPTWGARQGPCHSRPGIWRLTPSHAFPLDSSPMSPHRGPLLGATLCFSTRITRLLALT